MAKHLLTPRGVESKAPLSSGDKFYADGDGLYLRCRPSGKSWLFRYTSPTTGERRKLPLGPYPALSLSKAREAAEDQRKVLAQGEDPLDKRKHQALITELGETPQTLKELFDRWRIGYLSKKHEDGGEYVSRGFELHLLPHLGSIL